jgi:hypothetical protein
MNVYEVGLDVRFKEYGTKRPIIKTLTLWVLDEGSAEKAFKKAKKFAMVKKGWGGSGYPLSVKLTSVSKRGCIDVK